MKKLIFILFALILFSCKDEKPEPYEPWTKNIIGGDTTFSISDKSDYFIHNVEFPKCGVEYSDDHMFFWQKSVDGGTTWVTIPNHKASGLWIDRNKTVTTKYKRVIGLPACYGNESNIVTITIIP